MLTLMISTLDGVSVLVCPVMFMDTVVYIDKNNGRCCAIVLYR